MLAEWVVAWPPISEASTRLDWFRSELAITGADSGIHAGGSAHAGIRGIVLPSKNRNRCMKHSATDDAKEKPATTRRVVEIAWLPRTPEEWLVFTAARAEVARLWDKMAAMHALVRRWKWKWPTYSRWCAWAKDCFPALSAHSVQQTVANFCESLTATRMARRVEKKAGGEPATRYPWRSRRYRDVIYANDDAKIRGGSLVLPHGRHGGKLYVPLPKNHPLPGRIMEAQLTYGIVRIVCEVPDPHAGIDPATAPVVGVDLGVNTLVAATDGERAVLVSGRAAKAIVQYRNKASAELSSRIDRAKRGSKRRKRLVRAKYAMLGKSARKLKDTLHKATRAVANAFPGHRAVVGKPFNDAARKIGRKQAQQVSSASNAVLIALLAYKMLGAEKVPEPYSSQTCPGCGCRQKCRRVYQCAQCGWSAPRDVVGAINIRSIGRHGAMRPERPVPQRVTFVRPLRKYPAAVPRGMAAGSSGGTPARVGA